MPVALETALVLFSGGLDSTVCLSWALERFIRVETIGFTYGQRNAVELQVRPRSMVIHTPLMWIDKAETFALAHAIAGDAFIDLLVEETHTCYLGDREHRHPWGFGCGECPACWLRADGFVNWIAAR
jgi:7-cyano-7-deazaguanine synthase in queuosine biosynthesis